MILYLIGGLLAATLVASGIASCEHRGKVYAQAEREAVQARFDGFVIEAKRLGEEQNAKAKAKEEADRETLQKQKSSYEGQLAKLRSERNAAQRVLDHYASTNRGEMPGTASAPGAPGSGPADVVPRAALEQLARDAQETTLMFMECRDSWKAVAAR